MNSKLFALFALVAIVASQTTITLSAQSAGGRFGINPEQFLGLNVQASSSAATTNATLVLQTAGLLPSIYITNGGIEESLVLTLLPQSFLTAGTSGSVGVPSITPAQIAYLQANGATSIGALSATALVEATIPGIGLPSIAYGIDINVSSIISVTSRDQRGTGNLVFSVPTALVLLGFPINSSVNLISADTTSGNYTLVAPLVTVSGLNTIYSYSIAYNRAYIPIVLINSRWGSTFNQTFAAAINTTAYVQANTFLTFSSNQDVNFNNGFVAFYSTNGVQLTVNQNSYGSGNFVAPSNLVTLGQQFTITANGTAFNGNLSFVVQTYGQIDGEDLDTVSWYKASTGTRNGSGFTKVASTTSLDTAGNLIVTANVAGSFSEWTVATPASTDSSSSSSSRGSASMVAVSAAAVAAAVVMAL